MEEIKKRIAELMAADKYLNAFTECSKAFMLNPNDQEILDKVHFLWTRINDGNIELNPESADEFVTRGVAKSYKGDFKGALSDYNNAIKLNPMHDYAYKCRHFLHGAMELALEAKSDIETAIRINPIGEYYDDLGTLLSLMEDKKGAIASYQKAIELDPDAPRYWYNYGVELGEQGRLKEALEKFNRAIELWPEYEDAIVNRQYIQGLLNRN